MQLDIFEHSRDVMLRNDVLGALEQRQPEPARTHWCTLRDAYPHDVNLQPLALLIDVLAQASTEPVADALALREARIALAGPVTAAAVGQFGHAAGYTWLRPLWRSLAKRAAALLFNAEHEAEHEAEHAAPLWLRSGDWSAAMQATLAIESWHRIPAPLAWMAEARWRLDGADAAWGLLAELAWLAPRRFDAVTRAVDDPVMLKLQKAFDATFEGVGDTSDLAWFPAWALTQQPRLAPFLGQARPSLHTAPERAMRLLLELLGLERQGRHHDIVGRRKQLRDLNPSLYTSYLSTR